MVIADPHYRVFTSHLQRYADPEKVYNTFAFATRAFPNITCITIDDSGFDSVFPNLALSWFMAIFRGPKDWENLHFSFPAVEEIRIIGKECSQRILCRGGRWNFW